MAFDMLGSFRPDLPPAADPWVDPPDYAFVGGHNDPESIPFAGLAEAAVTVLRREGRNLATYNLGGSPQGYRPLREFVISTIAGRAGMQGHPDQVLIVSGSLQALDLVNEAMLSPGDTVIIEMGTYGGMVSRLDRLGVSYVGVDLDDHGIVPESLRSVLDRLTADGIAPRYLYTIPTVQNPTGSVMPLERRREILDIARAHAVPIFEDECYADLTWGCERPPSLRSLDGDGGQVIYCGSFSKSIAPALRVGYIVADEPVIRQLLALKTDAGTGALEQLTLAEYAPTHFEDHVDQLTVALAAKADAMVGAVREHFGDAVHVTDPMGGIYCWLTFAEHVDTGDIVEPAAAAGIEFNPGAGWSADPAWGRNRLRLCFGQASPDTIRAGVARFAEVCRAEGAI